MADVKEIVRKPVFIVGVVLIVALIVALSIVLANVKSLQNRQQRMAQKQPKEQNVAAPSAPLAPLNLTSSSSGRPSEKKADLNVGNRKLIMISIDGFRFDMLTPELTPNLMAIGNNGSIVPLEPQFPSLTFPNHYTIVTGLLPGEHGIIGNRFINLKTGKRFSVNEGTFRDPTWWTMDPLWTQVNSSVCMWPGSDVAINGKRPVRWIPYQGDMKAISRIDTLLSWIENDATNNSTQSNQLYMSYMSALDEASHDNGPDSPVAHEALKKIDSAIGYLWEGLRVRNLTDNVNLMVVSDHGFTTVPRANRISMHMLLPGYSTHLRFWECGAVTHIVPNEQDIPAVLHRLRKLSNRGFPYRVYTRDNLPSKWYLQTSHTQDTLPPIILVAKSGHAIDCMDFRKRNSNPLEEQNDLKPNDIIGLHGYDLREEPDMMAALIAAGPLFKKQRVGDSFSNLDVYNLASRILRVKPTPNNGTMRLAEAILQ